MARVALMLERGGMLTQAQAERFRNEQLSRITSNVFHQPVFNDVFKFERYFWRGGSVWAILFQLNVLNAAEYVSAINEIAHTFGLKAEQIQEDEIRH